MRFKAGRSQSFGLACFAPVGTQRRVILTQTHIVKVACVACSHSQVQGYCDTEVQSICLNKAWQSDIVRKITWSNVRSLPLQALGAEQRFQRDLLLVICTADCTNVKMSGYLCQPFGIGAIPFEILRGAEWKKSPNTPTYFYFFADHLLHILFFSPTSLAFFLGPPIHIWIFHGPTPPTYLYFFHSATLRISNVIALNEFCIFHIITGTSFGWSFSLNSTAVSH